MANVSTALRPAAVRNPKPVASLVKEKQKALAFVNWKIVDENGETLLRSTKGFSLFDNEYLTLEDKALISLAQNNGGSATVQALLTVVMHQEKPTSLDISKIKLVPKAA